MTNSNLIAKLTSTTFVFGGSSLFTAGIYQGSDLLSTIGAIMVSSGVLANFYENISNFYNKMKNKSESQISDTKVIDDQLYAILKKNKITSKSGK